MHMKWSGIVQAISFTSLWWKYVAFYANFTINWATFKRHMRNIDDIDEAWKLTWLCCKGSRPHLKSNATKRIMWVEFRNLESIQCREVLISSLIILYVVLSTITVNRNVPTWKKERKENSILVWKTATLGYFCKCISCNNSLWYANPGECSGVQLALKTSRNARTKEDPCCSYSSRVSFGGSWFFRTFFHHYKSVI